jgi:hypothetical protein
MITLIIIFISIYVWRDVKDEYETQAIAIMSIAAITSEISTNLSLINMIGNFIGGTIL